MDRYSLRKDISDFIRRIRLKEYFYEGDNVEGDFSNVPAFRNKSVWCPERGRELAIEAYAQAVEEEILSSIKNEGASYSNLSTSEREALKDLRSYNDIVIKEADKGSGVVVMDKDIYINEAFRQLGDCNVYRETPVDLTQQISKIVNDRIKKIFDDGYIDEKTLDYLLVNSNPRAGRFYLLPKIHKKGCPGRPVISGCGTSTERISEFVDSNIKYLVPGIPSYLRDTKHFLQMLGEVGTLPEGAILVTADVVGLYPHIPHEEGLRILREALTRSTVNLSVPADDLVDLARLVLTSNNLSFNGKHYLQIRGTAIGTKMAPSYANIFMGGLETKLFQQAPIQPVFWRRFIDDVFFIWTEGEESLKEFMGLMNSFHDTIKFTFDWSHSQVNFLDVNVMLNNGVISTDLFSKPTDKHQYLFHTSCHPNSCKKGIPFGQALRIRRICSTEDLFEKRAKEFCGYLIKRGYNAEYVNREIDRARRIPREDTLRDKQPVSNQRIPFVATFHPALPNVAKILHRLQPVLQSSRRCQEAIGEVPMVAFRRPKCLKDILVLSDLKTPGRVPDRGCRGCGDRRCKVCDFLIEGTGFKSRVTGRDFVINFKLDCNSDHVVYLLSCAKCEMQYIGSTINKFRTRFNNHKSRLNAHRRLSADGQLKDDIVYKHFNQSDHNGLDDVRVKLIDKCKGEQHLREREAQWAYRLRSIYPQGLNSDDFFCSRNPRRDVF